jgi:hypothetical protein
MATHQVGELRKAAGSIGAAARDLGLAGRAKSVPAGGLLEAA